MSYATFIASDIPMPEMENQHKQLLSVNEALAKGIAISNLVLDSATIDRDRPGEILWYDSEDNLGEITIHSTERPYYFEDEFGNPPTDLPCLSSLEWKYTKERVSKLIDFIRNHLEKAAVVEIWNTWIGDGRNFSEGVKKHNLHADELTTTDLEKLFSYDGCEPYDCIAVTR